MTKEEQIEMRKKLSEADDCLEKIREAQDMIDLLKSDELKVTLSDPWHKVIIPLACTVRDKVVKLLTDMEQEKIEYYTKKYKRL